MGLNHSPRIVTDGLVIYLDAKNTRSYPGSGNNVTDLSGRANNAVFSDLFNSSNGNRPLYDIDDVAGPNFYFPNDYSTINTSISLANSSFTISGWMSFANSASSVKLWGAGRSYPVSAGGGYTVVLSNATRISDSLWGGDTAYTVDIQSNTWYYITSTYSGNSPYQRRIYVNGIPASAAPTGINFYSTEPLRIGYYGAYDTNNWGFNGYKKVATFSVHDRVLSQAEILQNFNALRGRFGV